MRDTFSRKYGRKTLRQCRPTSLQRSVCRYACSRVAIKGVVTCGYPETGGRFQATLRFTG
ncbi:hypothetical protein KCP75_20445 [Salmonella enterica subsp. enterica]|nr:hypothetical protein KCP75_20445 [Salmonella enterica subsp. enterica]